MEIIAHRGASHDAPENTLAAVRLAWEQGADAVEVDVHLSADGHAMVIHDSNTKRTAGRNRAVSRQTLAELRALDVRGWKGERIPTLAEVLATVPVRKRLFIEIKARASMVAALEPVLTRGPCQPRQLILIGFSLPRMFELKRAFPRIEVCWLTKLRPGASSRRSSDTERLIQKIQRGGLDGVDACANEAITTGVAATIHRAGLKLYVWTVDDPAQASALTRAGVDGITTNRPGWLREQLV